MIVETIISIIAILCVFVIIALKLGAKPYYNSIAKKERRNVETLDAIDESMRKGNRE